MKFFGVHLQDLESDAFLSASNDQVATWLFLHALCCKELNGGIIAEAAKLPAKYWNRHGIGQPEILREASPLWSWNEADITVTPYDYEGQKLYEKKSKGGRDGAIQRWANRTPNRTPKKTPDGNADAPNLTQPDQTQPNPSQSSFALNGASSCSPQKMSWNQSNGFSGITDKDRESWTKAYPAVNIDRQLAASHEWLLSNPAKAKRSNWRRFITNWLSTKQDRGGDVQSNRPTTKHAGIQEFKTLPT